jgi:TRAP-type uncharacterized transport system fused permease subunit
VAQRDGIIKGFTVDKGQRIEGGYVIAETKAAPFRVFYSIFSAVLGTMAFSALTMLYLIRKTSVIEWLLLAAATVLLYWPSFVTNSIGLVMVALVYLSQRSRGKQEPPPAAA